MLVDDLIMALMQGLILAGEVAQYGLAIALPLLAVFWARVPASAGALAQFPHLVEKDAVGISMPPPKRVRPLVEASALLRAERIIARHASRHSPEEGEWIEAIEDGPEWNGVIVVEDQCVLLDTLVTSPSASATMPAEAEGPRPWREPSSSRATEEAAWSSRREPFPW